jgi:hypothetical protein
MLGSDVLNALATTGLVAADYLSHGSRKKEKEKLLMCIHCDLRWGIYLQWHQQRWMFRGSTKHTHNPACGQ